MSGIYTGDVSDDDADVFMRLTQERSEPPTPEEIPLTAGRHIPATERPFRPHRLITGTYTLNASGVTDPVQILWADKDRTALTLFVYSATSTDSIRIMDEPAKNTSGGASTQESASINAAQNLVSLGEYTGPLWISPEVGNAVKVSWMAVTK